MQFTVRITGDKETIAYLQSVRHELDDMSKPMRKIGSELKDFFSNDVFATQGGAIGERWPALAPSTIKQKSKRYRAFSVVPLVRTGKMKESFFFKADKTSVTIGNNAPQFIYHQSSAPRTKIPYRPMLAINESVRSIAQDIIQSHVDEIIRGR